MITRSQVQVSGFINSDFKIHTEKLNYRALRTFGKSRQRGMNAEICEQKVNHGFPFVQKTITPKEGEGKKGEQFSKFQNTVWISERSTKRAATN